MKFSADTAGEIYWRMPPDTFFTPFRAPAVIDQEGAHTLEYYLKLRDGSMSPLIRSVYFTDWTPPRISAIVEKCGGDSIAVSFECSKNAAVYYTTDGSSPLMSPAVSQAGNKLLRSRDRIVMRRTDHLKIMFYAEDLAGNRSAVKTIDMSKPWVAADIPSGADRIYNRILSVTLATDNRSSVYYAHHGRMPTLDSAVFNGPITVTASDTIIAFAVDPSGLAGDPDTLVYLIDLPPAACFTVSPDTVYAGMKVQLDASTSADRESPLSRLKFKWYFEGDGRTDSLPASSAPLAAHMFGDPGQYTVRLAVIDERGNIGAFAHTVIVNYRCPPGMVSAAKDDGGILCIDKYEYPNVAAPLPAQRCRGWRRRSPSRRRQAALHTAGVGVGVPFRLHDRVSLRQRL